MFDTAIVDTVIALYRSDITLYRAHFGSEDMLFPDA